MKVKIQVEFEVTGTDDEEVARSAASLTAYNNLCLFETEESVLDEVTTHVDGFGDVTVKLGEGHD